MDKLRMEAEKMLNIDDHLNKPLSILEQLNEIDIKVSKMETANPIDKEFKI